MSIIVQKATTKDIPVVLEMLYELGRPKPEKDSDVEMYEGLLRQYIADPDKTILVAQSNGHIVGMASIMFLHRLNKSTQEMYIPELVVLSEFQRQGIGKKLVKVCIGLANEKQCHRVRLESAKQRKNAHQFYERLGFEGSATFFSFKLT